MVTIHNGVVERLPSGHYDAALDTDDGPLLLRNVQGADHQSADRQVAPSRGRISRLAADHPGKLTAEQLLRQMADAGDDAPCSLLCTIELTRFDLAQRQLLLPVLWRYIINHRNGNGIDELTATGAATRKYVAIMPMDRMGDLVVLLEPGHRAPVAIDLEIEVAKMVYRNFEVHPPTPPDPHPELAERLWEMAQAYINPRVLLRDKYPAATSLAIAASVVGAIALTDDKVRKIRTCIDRHASEHRVFLHVDRRQLLAAAPTMYRIHPHAEPFHEDNGRYARTRFSCAGFVFEAYKKARIALVDLNSLPMCDIAVIDKSTLTTFSRRLPP